MATVFKRGGKANRGGYWYIGWKDCDGKRQIKCSRTTEKATAERIAAKWEADAAARRTGVIDVTLERFSLEGRRPIADHVTDFESHLRARQNTAKHVALTVGHVQAIISACCAQTSRDLTCAGVMSAIESIRLAGNKKVKDESQRVPLSLRTCNAHLVSIKAFSRWLWMEKRSPDDLLIGLRSFNDETDRRHVRREFTIEELTYLLESIQNRTLPEHRISGPDRAIACRLALGTGLRAGELRSLTTASFNFTSETPTVSVAAACSKRRHDDVLPLQGDLADLLKTWMDGKPENVKIFKHLPQNTARMLRADLKAARAQWISEAQNDQERAKRAKSDFLRYRNSAGEVVDFHATRHTFISSIVAGGASVKVAQELARHSTSRLTVDRYAHARLHDLQGAVDSLPGYEQPPGVEPENEALRATGTDGTKTYDSRGAQRPVQRSTRNRSFRCETRREFSRSHSRKRIARRFSSRSAGRRYASQCDH